MIWRLHIFPLSEDHFQTSTELCFISFLVISAQSVIIDDSDGAMLPKNVTEKKPSQCYEENTMWSWTLNTLVLCPDLYMMNNFGSHGNI